MSIKSVLGTLNTLKTNNYSEWSPKYAARTTEVPSGTGISFSSANENVSNLTSMWPIIIMLSPLTYLHAQGRYKTIMPVLKNKGRR